MPLPNKNAEQKANLKTVFQKFRIPHLYQYFYKTMTLKGFSELQSDTLEAYGIQNEMDAMRLCDAVEYAKDILNSPSLLSVTEVLDGVEECDPTEDKMDVHKRDSRYTARGTTVLTRTPDNREVKRKSRIVVAIRKRPINAGEEAGGFEDVMESNNISEIILKEPKVKVDLRKYIHIHRFYFDKVFDETCTNENVYQRTARDLIDTVMDGGSATCFAYGQTGSGKTHTMLGKDEEPGLYALAARDLYACLNIRGDLVVSFYEIYGGRLYDLLNRRQLLRCLEDEKGKVNVRELTEHISGSVDDLMRIIEQGSRIRSSGCTGANDTSSRSHAILELKPRVHDISGPKYSGGKFTFIDLAGSERGADTIDCARQIRMEGAEINKSLLALKECIRFLDQNKKHVPFRGSKLTEVLRDSFVGNCRTVMIGTVSPANNNCEHTLNTLRYADRVKELKRSASNKPTLEENEQKQIVYMAKPPLLKAHRPATTIPGKSSRFSLAAPLLSGRSSGLCNQAPTVLNAMASQGPVKRGREEVASLPPSSPSEAGLRHGGTRQEHDAESGGYSGPLTSDSHSSAAPAHAALLESAMEAYKHYLDVDMYCIREEHQVKFNAQQERVSADEFIKKARELVDAKCEAMNHFLARLEVLEKTPK
ncbi:unnamed protein product [Phytomonas sp. Hart1]|nr:unnamed protein product [Phytomonas sp. Hart1]|eukprot:CCW71275.1 unnamed protein product [Phytomonas sp. isolate Hart1]